MNSMIIRVDGTYLTVLRNALPILLVSILFSTTSADAQYLVQSVDREVSAFGTSFCPGCGENGEDEVFSNGSSIPSTAVGLFDEVVGSVGSDAGQTSTVSSSQLSGSGSIFLGGTGDNNASSSLAVEFMVSNTGTYQLSGDLTISPGEFETVSQVSLSSPGGDLLSELIDFGSTTFDDSFLLEVGTLYTLDISVDGSDFEGIGSSGGWSFSLVPEPSSAVLFAGFLVAIGARRRQTAR